MKKCHYVGLKCEWTINDDSEEKFVYFNNIIKKVKLTYHIDSLNTKWHSFVLVLMP